MSIPGVLNSSIQIFTIKFKTISKEFVTLLAYIHTHTFPWQYFMLTTVAEDWDYVSPDKMTSTLLLLFILLECEAYKLHLFLHL